MWAAAAILVLLFWAVGQQISFRSAKKQWEAQLEAKAQELASRQSLCALQEETIASLSARLSEKEAQLQELAAQPRQKLYLPEEAPADPREEPMVYFNENTGIYHADRACAPYQAVPMALGQLPEQARPCKKCAEGQFPAPPPAEPTPESASEEQISLFDGDDVIE